MLVFLLLTRSRAIPPQPYSMTTLSTPPDINPYDSFGVSVSIKGDAIAVGADVGGNSSQGVVHTFTRDEGSWVHDKEFLAADGKNGDRYGNSVVVFDEFLFVGAFLQDRSGKVYVYRHGEPHFELVPLVREQDGYFGHTVKATNYTLAVGHPAARVEQEHESGNVVVYNNWGINWVISNYVTPAVPTGRNLHGFSVDFDRGDEFMVGAPQEGTGGHAYIYKYGQDDRWNVEHRESGVDHMSELGHAVAISGNHSAMTSKVGGSTRNGYVVTFKRINGEWVKGQTLVGDVSTAGNQQGSAYYGSSIVLKDHVMAVGSPFEGATGAVYVYHWWDNVNEWRLHHKLVGPAPDALNWYHSMFGWSLAADVVDDDHILIVGSPGARTIDGTERAGSVFIFSAFNFEQPTTPAPTTAAPTTVAPTSSPTNTPPPTTVPPPTTTTTAPTGGSDTSGGKRRGVSLLYMAIVYSLLVRR